METYGGAGGSGHIPSDDMSDLDDWKARVRQQHGKESLAGEGELPESEQFWDDQEAVTHRARVWHIIEKEL